MINTKSDCEIEKMKQAGLIVAKAMEAVAAAIKPGVTTKNLEEIAEKVIRNYQAIPSFKGYDGFPSSICASVNHVLIHGIPDDTVLKEGDIISVDLGACYEGYHGDAAWTFPVGKISQEAKMLIDTCRESLFEGLKQVKPGNRLGDISHAIGTYAQQRGYMVPIGYTGHGIGTQLHEEPPIPNVGVAGEGILLKEGMTLAIEPMIVIGKPFTRVLEDNWTVVTKDGSLAAHHEHTVLITKDGYEILTLNREDKQSIYG